MWISNILRESSGPILLTAFSQPEGQLDKAVQIARIIRLSIGVIGSLRLVHVPQHVADVKLGSPNAGVRSIPEGHGPLRDR